MNILCFVVLLGFIVPASIANAVVISSNESKFKVGIDSLGNLYDTATGIGFLRTSDGYDPVQAGLGREAWGVAAGSVSGFVDLSSATNIISAVPPIVTPHAATISTVLNVGQERLLKIINAYMFAGTNIIKITIQITNISHENQHIWFSRNVNWNISPTPGFETITIPTFTSHIVQASFYGFESANPLDSFIASASQKGGIRGPDDLGAGILLDLGSLSAGSDLSFNIFEAISQNGQSEANLRSQVQSLGATFVISGVSADLGGTNSAALGVSFDHGKPAKSINPVSTPSPPEPDSISSPSSSCALLH